MITIKNGDTRTVKLKIWKGKYKLEDFTRAMVKILLCNDTDRQLVTMTLDEEGLPTFNMPASLEVGTYGVKVIWVKNALRRTKTNEAYMMAESSCFVCVSNYDEDCTDMASTDVITVDMNCESYGYDGLSAYETALLYGVTTALSEKEYVQIRASYVDTNQINDNAITTAKIADEAVTTAKLADYVEGDADKQGVTTAKIADGAVTTEKIADEGVTTEKIADEAVTTEKIADGAITNEKVQAGTITGDRIKEGTLSGDRMADDFQVTDAMIKEGTLYQVQQLEAEWQEAENKRVSAESQREKQAESDHNTADGDHDRAESDHRIAAIDNITVASDHTQASEDHNTASGDHTQAGKDSEQASSDHEQAGEDHSQAVKDSEQAASDHTTASGDHTAAEADHEQAVADHGAAVLTTADQGLTDEQKVNARANIEAAKESEVSEIATKTSQQSLEYIETEDDSIIIEDNEGNTLATIDSTKADFKNLQSNGVDVITYIDKGLAKKQNVIDDISKETIEEDDETIVLSTDKDEEVIELSCEIKADENEEQVYSNDDETDVYAKIGSYGIKAKNVTDLNGNIIGKTKVTNLYCYPTSGTDDSTHFYGLDAIKNALESITDASESHRYVINVRGHFVYTDVSHHTKCMGNENTHNAWWVNAYGKDYVTIDGGDKNQTSIEMYLSLDTDFPTWNTGTYKYYGGNYHVFFNNAKWFEMKNITLIGENTRYCLHQEAFNDYTPSYASFENCVFKYKYDGIWTKDNTKLPDGTTILNGNAVAGCGYRIGGDINYRYCDFISYSRPSLNTALVGSHSGYWNSPITEYIPAIIKLDNCRFDGDNVVMLGYYSTSWQANDLFYFSNCKVADLASINFGVRATNVHDKATSCPKVFIAHSPMPVKIDSRGSQVLKVIATSGTSSAIRISDCSAYDIFGENTDDIKPTINDWGAYNYNGYIYKDDANGLNGYLLGTQALASKTLGAILGDCSSNNKVLTISLNGVETSYTFNTNLTDISNDDIVSMLNSAFSDLSFSIVGLSDYEYPVFDDISYMMNSGNSYIERGMGIVLTSNGFRIATKTDVVDGICIDDTPIGQYGRVALSGMFNQDRISVASGITLTDGYYGITDDGKFSTYSDGMVKSLRVISKDSNKYCLIIK